jgi:hypothetical protein
MVDHHHSDERAGWRFIACAPLVLAVALSAGCGANKLFERSPASAVIAPPAGSAAADPAQPVEAKEPYKLTIIWSDAVYTTAGKPPTRGFGGRVFFYDAAENPVPVDGELMIFAFDDSKPGGPGEKPDRQYAFTREHLQNHYGPSKLGPSYSIWVPWQQIGGEKRNISLLPVFTSASGKVVMGQQVPIELPGKQPEHLIEDLPPGVRSPAAGQHAMGSSVQQASHTASADGFFFDDAPRRTPQFPGVQTTTLNVPPTLQRQMNAAALQAQVERIGNSVLAANGRASNAGQASVPSGHVPSGHVPSGQASPPAMMSTPQRTVGAGARSFGYGSQPQPGQRTALAPGASIPPILSRQKAALAQPSARYGRLTRPAPTWPAVPPGSANVPSGPYPAAPPSGLPTPPATATGMEAGPLWQAAARAGYVSGAPPSPEG